MGIGRAAWTGAVQRLGRPSSVVPLVVALAVFGLPLFVGLGNWDLENDEAIYSYSVDRILETGEWLTPRSIMVDGPFLEKPPLKTWIVAAGIELGLPRDERGLRFWDALFALAAFGYVFVIGRRLSGLLCAVTALLVLLTCWPLMFEHGIRTNNMEAALLLTYGGGVYHFFRWTEAATPGDRRRHAWAVALFFAFGFLTKFVAALFLPVVLGAAFIWQPDVRTRLRDTWPDWLRPAIAVVAIVAPWFVYQSAVNGRVFWTTILGVHVFQRFTASVDPAHLQPWYFYFARTFAAPGPQTFPPIITAVGLILLAWRAWQGQPRLARLVLVWWVVPFALVSAGSSKIIHYVYPFYPPVALAAGLAVAAWVEVTGAWIRGVTTKSRVHLAFRGRPTWRHTLVVLGCACVGLGIWAALVDTVTISAFGVRLFRSAGLARPALIGALFFALARETRAALWVATTLVVLFVTPVPDYFMIRDHMATIKHPLHSIRDCVVSRVGVGPGVYVPDPTKVPNPQYYYLRNLGPWAEGPANREQELGPRLFTPGRQTIVLMSKRDIVPPPPTVPEPGDRGGLSPGIAGPGPDVLEGVETIADVVVWLPGPFAACAAAGAAAGGVPAFAGRRPVSGVPAPAPVR